jgi:ABC-type dipeptide/oligopeptide/nickel transport system permease component
MVKYVTRRLMITVITFFIISFVVFQLIYGIWNSSGRYFPMPGLDSKHWNEPRIAHYIRWIGAIISGDFGESIMSESYYSK